MYTVEEIFEAMEKGELQAYYQPQYDAMTCTITSAEALVRWVKPDGKVISPAMFVPEAEKSDAITAIDWYMLECACRMLKKQEEDGRQFPVAVNFSRRHIGEESFIEKLSKTVDSYGLDHSLIEVEITESAMVDDMDSILEWISDVHNAGFIVAIDDFGSGLSSLQFVKEMPADILKIDKSLLSGNCENEKERIVLESIFYFANRLNMTTIAEGVETKEQLAFMRTCDCKKIQGYYFARPMNESDYLQLCREYICVDNTADILKIQAPTSALNLLMKVVFRRYPLVIFSNLTRNSFYMMTYKEFTSTGCPSTGVFDELIEHGTLSMHPDDREAFSTTFNRLNLLSAHENGIKEVRLITKQLGDDGVYRRVETTDYFVKSPSSDDVLVITLCDNLPED